LVEDSSSSEEDGNSSFTKWRQTSYPTIRLKRGVVGNERIENNLRKSSFEKGLERRGKSVLEEATGMGEEA